MKRNQPDVRLLVYLSASHNPLRLSLNQARNRVGREPFKGLMMASIAGMLTRVRLFR